ncbi:hypothetical protein MIND_00006600 [Mycena indigotica]|uniref:BTB domain-containing protein n=1 Tax=Mycena indigotica TaxID=2126181 RepID=A0A8H6WEL1_9AGAR|nr:uncharacterized protein MIND_00006600 [Mycena indigotica]KAF7314927.1 hypothetical protein MIND_00006600 [Mycena indigotica]
MNLERVPELWFEDGNVVLQAEGQVVFKVFQGILAARSPIFKDMFSFPQPQQRMPEDEYDGCPLVPMAGDSAHEVAYFLQAIFNSEFFPAYPAPTDFHVVEGCLRMSHKYQVDYLKQRALVHLSSGFPTELALLDKRRYHSGPTGLLAAERTSWLPPPSPNEYEHIPVPTLLKAIALAHEVQALWILPLAFYYLACHLAHPEALVHHPLSNSRANQDVALSEGDGRAFLRGHAAFNQTAISLLAVVSDYHSSKSTGCKDPPNCKAVRLKALSRFLDLAGKRLRMPLHVFRVSPDGPLKKACPSCYEKLAQALREKRDRLWDEMPATYGLRQWEDLTKMKREALSFHHEAINIITWADSSVTLRAGLAVTLLLVNHIFLIVLMADFVPPEIIDLIIEEVKDRPALRSCCLAASIFREPCQRRLWRSLSVELTERHGATFRPNGAYLGSFFTAGFYLDIYPHIAGYVTDLEVSIELRAHAAWQFRHSFSSLKTILNSLPRLARLTITSADLWGQETYRASPGTASLCQLDFENFPIVPPQLVRDALMASQAWKILPILVRGLLHSNASRVNTTIVDMGCVINFKLVQPYIRSIRALVLGAGSGLCSNYGDEEFSRTVPRVLSVMSETLEYLSVELPSEDGLRFHEPAMIYPTDMQNLPQSFPRLQYLQIGFQYVMTDDSRRHVPPPLLLFFLSSILSRTSSNCGGLPALYLCAQITVAMSGPLDGAQIPTPRNSYRLDMQAVLEGLDQVLYSYMSRHVLGRVCYVPQFYTTTCYPRSNQTVRLWEGAPRVDWQEYTEAIRTSLPKAMAAGLKIVDFDSDWREPMVEF